MNALVRGTFSLCDWLSLEKKPVGAIPVFLVGRREGDKSASKLWHERIRKSTAPVRHVRRKSTLKAATQRVSMQRSIRAELLLILAYSNACNALCAIWTN